jgi:ATP-dependent Clp protease ATP-binding subunit ClpX
VSPDDLVKFGLIPEFVGRFPTTVTLSPLWKADLLRILTDVKDNYIDQYRWLFGKDGVDLTFTPAALEALVDRAISSGTGARALHSEIERALMAHMFGLIDYVHRGIKCVEIGAEDINNPVPR